MQLTTPSIVLGASLLSNHAFAAPIPDVSNTHNQAAALSCNTETDGQSCIAGRLSKMSSGVNSGASSLPGRDSDNTTNDENPKTDVNCSQDDHNNAHHLCVTILDIRDTSPEASPGGSGGGSGGAGFSGGLGAATRSGASASNGGGGGGGGISASPSKPAADNAGSSGKPVTQGVATTSSHDQTTDPFVPIFVSSGVGTTSSPSPPIPPQEDKKEKPKEEVHGKQGEIGRNLDRARSFYEDQAKREQEAAEKEEKDKKCVIL